MDTTACEVSVSLAIDAVTAGLCPPEQLAAGLGEELDLLAADLAIPARLVARAGLLEPAADAAPRAGWIDLYLDGEFMDSCEVSGDPIGAAVQAVRARLDALATPRLVQHAWETWGGTGSAPVGFAALARLLLRNLVRLDRIAEAVPRWRDADPVDLFEQALGATERRILAYLNPQRLEELQPAFVEGPDSPVNLMTDGLYYEIGLMVGECGCRADPAMPATLFRLRINDARTGPLPLIDADEVLVNDTPDRLTLLNIAGRAAINPANGAECAIIAAEYADIAEQAGLTTWRSDAYLVLAMSAQIRFHAPAMLSSDALRFQLISLERAFPYLVHYVEGEYGTPGFARILRHLLAEGVGIRNLRQVVDALALIAPAPEEAIDRSRLIVFQGTAKGMESPVPPTDGLGDPLSRDVAEGIRVNLKSQLSHKYTRGGSTLVVYLLEPAIEERLRDPRPLSRRERRDLLEAVRGEVGNLPPTAQSPVILTAGDTRWRIRSQVQAGFPHLAVLCYEELSPTMNIQPIARITLEEDASARAEERIEDLFARLDYAQAQQELLEDADAFGQFPAWTERRLFELLCFWTLAGDLERAAHNLAGWISLGLATNALDTRALARDPGQSGITHWLQDHDPVLYRVLRARYLPGTRNLLSVQGGRYPMGGPRGDDPATAAHEVGVGPYSLAPVPVSAAQFALYLHATGRAIPPDWVGATEAARAIGWHQAIDYCQWLSRANGLAPAYEVAGETEVRMVAGAGGFRLPTEAEWEFAARGGVRSHGYRFAGSDRLGEVGDPTGREPIAQRRANELGLYDLSGGRAEWCWDRFAIDYYGQSPGLDPHGPDTGSKRVCRGADPEGLSDTAACRVWTRLSAESDPDRPAPPNTGFRLARSGIT